MITVNKIEPLLVEHFDGDHQSLGFLNEYESLDLRCQIAEQNIQGFYLKFNGNIVNISEKGRVAVWHHGLYDLNEINLARLFKANRQKTITKL